MKIKRFNESAEQPKTFGELIGNIIKEHKAGYSNILETDKGVFLYTGDKEDVESQYEHEYRLHEYRDGKTGEISIKSSTDRYWSPIGYVYFENGNPKIISYWPGDERGCVVFNNTFITSGHDGNYLFNINNPVEFMSNTW